MKFCPNCGKKRENDKCDCGYDYNTGDVVKTKEGIKKEANIFNGMMYMNNLINKDIQQNQGAISLEELKKRKVDLGDLNSISYTCSGGMMGQYYNEELVFEKNELNITNQDWHHGPKTRTTYKVDKDKAEEIKKILIDNNFRAWSEIPIDRSMIAMDAPTSSVGLAFEKGYSTISTMIYMSDEENKIFHILREKMKDLVKEENIIKEEVLEKGQSLNMLYTAAEAEPLTNRIFCPECGSPIEKGETKCSCGYIPNKK